MTDELVSSAIQPAKARRMPTITRNLGHPRGIVGHFTGRLMHRGNDSLNEWVVDRLADRHESGIDRIVEIGPGPGVGLSYLLSAFPGAKVWGIDHSALMVRQARRNNSEATRSGRLNVLRGNLDALPALAPVDLVVAVNVLYFWADPYTELQKVRRALGDNGTMCLGYQLRRHMSPNVQETFPRAGHRLYDTDEQVTRLLLKSGFGQVDVSAGGPHRMQLAFN
jgi:SAM-dependent methyltransferase